MGECNRIGGVDLCREVSESLFLLRKSSSSSTVSIQVDFSSLSVEGCGAVSAGKGVPIFNDDRNYFTPSFILELDQQRYGDNLQIYLNIHNRKSLQISEQKAELFVPKPSKNNSFCCVCKTPFDDYLTHLSRPKHQYLSKKSDYYQKIKDLCTGYRETNVESPVIKRKRGRPCKPKTRQIKKTVSTKSVGERETCLQGVQESNKCPNVEISIMN